jgi:hypothetical protein
LVSAAARVIRWSTALAVLGVAVVAAVASYEHAYDLVRAYGEAALTPHLVPLTVDGLIYASSMVMLDSMRCRTPVPALARWLLGPGRCGDARGQRRAWLRPWRGRRGGGRVACGCAVGSYELLMMVIRRSQVPADVAPEVGPNADPLQERAAELFAGQLAADQVPSVRTIRAQLHVGQIRAQRLRAYLATGADRPAA